MTTILGIDVSSYRLDGGLITSENFQVAHRILGKAETGKNKRPALEQLVERVGKVQFALEDIIGELAGYCRVDWIVIEDAYGISGRARKALDLTVGAVIAAVPGCTKVKLLKASEWRSYMGAKNTKLAGHGQVKQWLFDGGFLFDGECSLDEHELDALGVALGWAAKLKQGDT